MERPTKPAIGGIIHTYQKYDPKRFPSPTQPPPDMLSTAFDHLLMFGSMRQLTEDELARAVHLDPSQIRGLGPSLDALLALLRERKRKILETYETGSVQQIADEKFQDAANSLSVPKPFRERFARAIRDRQLYELERIWYAVGNDQSPFARQLVPLMERLGEKYEIDELAGKYEFTGRQALTVPEAIAIKEELEKIDELLKQLEEARKSARIAVIDIDALAEFAEPGDIENLRALEQFVQDYVREMAQRQGLESNGGYIQLTPKAYRIFQGKLLERIFSDLQASRSGRHQNSIDGDGAVELPSTKPYEFGDSLANMDIPQTFLNAMLQSGTKLPIRLTTANIEVHRTRNTPKCATAVVMDMSGSMRYDGQYINVKRMALAFDGLIRREYPGDVVQFVEMYTFAKLRPPAEIIDLIPKPVTVYDPVIRLRADMSRPDLSESLIHPHFTNIQHGLRIARQLLASQGTPNRQIILITDGLPTAHFEGNMLYMMYPPNPRTESATLREGLLCVREGITINIFLLPSWSQTEEDIRFAYRLAESTKGRVFFTAGRDLDRFVIWDYVHRRRTLVG
jgi:uncharacterized protein with von Willebrand factor type A (vWA) domain